MGWQNEKGEATPWIQVISPHGGGGKGFHFIPEKGEKVMVDFQGGNAELPYVIGNMFNTNAKSGFHKGDNSIKAIRTRSGNSIVLDDATGSVNIADKGAANLFMDGVGNATLNALASKTINVGKGGESKLFMDSSGKITLDGAESLTITIGSSKLEMKKDGTFNINGKTVTMDSTGGPMTISTDNELTVTGGSKATISSGDTNVM